MWPCSGRGQTLSSPLTLHTVTHEITMIQVFSIKSSEVQHIILKSAKSLGASNENGDQSYRILVPFAGRGKRTTTRRNEMLAIFLAPTGSKSRLHCTRNCRSKQRAKSEKQRAAWLAPVPVPDRPAGASHAPAPQPPNHNGGRGAPTSHEKVALGHKVAALIRLAESDFPKPPKWPSVLSRASHKVVVPPGVLLPGVLVRQNAHHYYKDRRARAVLLEHHGLPASTTGTQTPSKRAKRSNPM